RHLKQEEKEEKVFDNEGAIDVDQYLRELDLKITESVGLIRGDLEKKLRNKERKLANTEAQIEQLRKILGKIKKRED
ncbi:MAG: hypothetical protein ACUVUE_04165, partial [Candidatus Bathycorpusculaceae bacterium]